MKMTDLFLAELEGEGRLTRRVLEQVPEGHADWKPHEKSMSLGQLSELVASIPAWVALTIDRDELDVSTAVAQAGHARSVPELLQLVDASIEQGRASLARTNDEHLLRSWRMLAGGRVVSQQPRYLVLRHGVFNHLAHHRGQLTVYLRLVGATVPAIYGPSADDRRFS